MQKRWKRSAEPPTKTVPLELAELVSLKKRAMVPRLVSKYTLPLVILKRFMRQW